MSYFIIRCDEDGTTVEQMTQEELEKNIAPDAAEYLTFLDHIPRNDKGYWIEGDDRTIVIIKGEIVVPHTSEIVMKLGLP